MAVANPPRRRAPLPLDGFVVGVTADRRWEEQAELLRRRGARVVHGPSIRTQPLGPDGGLQGATQALLDSPPSHVIANTGIGVRAWLEAAESWGAGDALVDVLRGARIYARGPKAAGAIGAMGLEVTASSATGRLDDLVDQMLAGSLAGARVALQRDGSGSPAVNARLGAAGAEVIEVPVYRWTLPDDHAPALRLAQAVIAGRVQAVTFTSSPALRNLFSIAQEHSVDAELRDAFNGKVAAACVGPVCADAARSKGIDAPLVPGKARLGPLVLELAEHLVDHGRDVELRGMGLSLRGTVVHVGAERIELSEREASLLAALATRPGSVLTRAELLHEVWGDGDADPHLVEVTIGRLRRRLGPRGDAIVAVRRRGYRLDAAVAASA